MDSLEFIHSMKDVLITYTCNAGTFDTTIQHANPKEMEQLEKDLKVLQILKEKKVDLPKIAEWLADNNLKNIKGTIEYYNRYIVNGYMKELTEEEMQLIVEWLTEQPIAYFTRDVFREDQKSKKSQSKVKKRINNGIKQNRSE